MIKPLRVVSALNLWGLVLVSSPGWAGGIMVYEAGQEGMGLANAGAAALATDPSILMNNPAGISQLAGTQVNANGQLILGDLRFSPDGQNQFSGSDGGNALKYLPGASLFISQQLDERWSVGFGMYGNFGLALKYDDDWVGRYFTQESAIIGISLQPTVAYKINDDLSVGLGPRLMFGYFRAQSAINNNLLGLTDRPDGQLDFKDTDFGVGVNLGALYRINERTQLGVAYTSKIDLSFKDRPNVDNVSNRLLDAALRRASINSLSLDMQVPQTLLLSVTYDLDPQWKLLGSLGWQDWSQFGKVGVAVDANTNGASTTVDQRYKDSWHASVGAQYQVDPKLRWNMGLAYDSSIVADKDRTVDNPVGATWRLATGVNYAAAKGLDVHFGYTLIWLGDLEVEQTKSRSGTTLSGTYKDSALHVLGGGVVWRF